MVPKVLGIFDTKSGGTLPMIRIGKIINLQDSARKGFVWQNLPEKWLSGKICRKNGYLVRFLQKNGYIARFCKRRVYLAESARRMVIWQNLPEEWLSCTILAEKLLSCQILTKGNELVPVELHFNYLTKYNLLKLISQYSCFIDLIKEHDNCLKNIKQCLIKSCSFKIFVRLHFT